MPIPTRPADCRLGSLSSLVTAVLVATQEPFSALAARRLSSSYFIFLTQFALLLSVPLLTLSRSSRRDFIKLMANIRNLSRLAILWMAKLDLVKPGHDALGVTMTRAASDGIAARCLRTPANPVACGWDARI
jgi:hypothetical protein